MELRLARVILISLLTAAVVCSENSQDPRKSFRASANDAPDVSVRPSDGAERTKSNGDRARRIKYQSLLLNSFGSKIHSSRGNSTHSKRENENDYNLLEPGSDFTLDKLSADQNDTLSATDGDRSGNLFQHAAKDLALAGSETGKTKKGSQGKDEDEEEKTLAQQVADGKYGLIQNELFANGSNRPGILSYLSNSEVPKDTRENLGGLEKDEIWLAEDHILVLRGGRYGDGPANDTSPPIWAPIDDYTAPSRQVKIPKNPKIPPPFPVQLTEDGPVQFIAGKAEPTSYPQIVPPFHHFPFQANKSLPFLYGVPPNSVEGIKNLSVVLPIPPVPPLPPFLGQFPPGATFLSPPGNGSDIDEDDPSIYYPPKYDFYYPQANNSPVPPGPLVPGIILPPPPNFFAPLENETTTQKASEKNETDVSFNTISRPPFAGPKYLPTSNKQSVKLTILHNRNPKRPISSESDFADIKNQVQKTTVADERKKQLVSYVYPENTKPKTRNELSAKTSHLKVPAEEHFKRPILLPSKDPSIYHALPTTSPKPNHITVPNTLSKDIYIVTTPEAGDHSKPNEVYKKSKKNKPVAFVNISPEQHPLRSLIRPNISVSYTGKYGHLPPGNPSSDSRRKKPTQPPVTGHFITVKPPEITHNSITPTADVNVTPIPIVKKIRTRPIVPEKSNPALPNVTPSKATFYFYEEPTKTETPKEIIRIIDATEAVTPNKPEPNNEIGSIAQYIGIPISTSKIPIRQFLEETFHSNAITQQPPLPEHSGSTGGYPPSERPKSKPAHYQPQVSPNPVISYQHITEVPPLIIPHHRIKALEIHNSGSTGLQKVNLDKANVRVPSRPSFFSAEIFSSPKPQTVKHFSTTYAPATQVNLPSPIPDENETPFIPSNYYATARPEHVHFTSHEQTLVDDITKNYFTIFGQKIHSIPTTPLTPVKLERPKPPIAVGKGKNVQIIPEDETSSTRPAQTKTRNKTTTTGNVVPQKPQSHFEQYLKEITGEDQSDYIVTGVQGKIPKGKGFLPLGPIPGIFRSPLYPSQSIPLHALRVEQEVEPYSGVVNIRQADYPPNYSTTLRPVLDVEVNPQFVRHVTSAPRPFPIIQPSVQHQKVPLAHNLGQYLQEITSFTSPSTVNPIVTKNRSSKLIAPPSALSAKGAGPPDPVNAPKETPKRPLSLESDILVNYKSPLPNLNHEAEPVNVKSTRESPYNGGGANIKIVDSPDLSKGQNNLRHRPDQYELKTANNYDSTKNFFQNLPNSGYFSPSHQSTGNSFVSYNLPGNGGHFYFLTPQILGKAPAANEQRMQNRSVRYNKPQISSRIQHNSNPNKNNYRNNYFTDVGHNLTKAYSNHDYIRRRRKKS